ncbi:P-loop containing nucleoside triphosphate hydrolase protein [Russula earlei]|uniref:P-loop containing nucleoside triphosphate hydrolase protein n=1 Tax=Russula earlei TaxID=71964 RepID=A0ACC0UCI5_9AGAM|nr:P-loop containing nucleoside triphosphate hydrolase protein [Russula earlei]
MSTLNKLAIRGIRSFDDKNLSVIEFFSPVTVIVGHNGSGKTTIIECLKYATTGDQPPGTRGGAFVHDPKMANEKEVKAQVKLRFYAANGRRMLAVRNLSVTMKKTAGMTMKTLEGILALDNGNAEKSGKRSVISTKCAELDVEIPHLLGVSKAVLENVIFCHQEDSYWPLAEASVLKKKFDDIFEATKYTKALDSIKALRKERVAELKTEKERLESLAREKGHADKLRAEISATNTTIATKEGDYQEAKKLYEALARSNRKFEEGATKFREIYIRVESLEKEKQKYQEDLAELRPNVQEVPDTNEQLEERIKNFNAHIAEQRNVRRREEAAEQDKEDELSAARRKHVELNEEHGQLTAEAKAQEERILDREALIREIATHYGIRGFDMSPLERDKLTDFTTKLGLLLSQQTTEVERVQNEIQQSNTTYNERSRQLHAALERDKQQRASNRSRIAKLQSDVASAEVKIEAAELLDGDLLNIVSDIEGKNARIEKLKADIANAKHEDRIADLNNKIRAMEDERDNLSLEIRTLSLQSDARAKLTLHQRDLAAKEREIKNILQISSAKFSKLVGAEASAETMESDVNEAITKTERAHLDLEAECSLADRKLHEAETNSSSLKSQLKAKTEELRGLEKRLKDGLEDHASVESAIKETTDEINFLRESLSKSSESIGLYQKLLTSGRTNHICEVCNRHMTNEEMKPFESYLNERIKQTSPGARLEYENDLKSWELVLEGYRELMSLESSVQRLKEVDISLLEKQIQAQDELLPSLAEVAEKVNEKLQAIKKELKELASLRQHAVNVSRLHTDCKDLRKEISNVENSLAVTGSTKTADDVQQELDALSVDLRNTEKEKQNVQNDRERRSNVLRANETELHQLQLQETDLRSKVREKEAHQKSVEAMQLEMASLTNQMKELDVQILEGQGPIDLLDREHQAVQMELNTKLSQAQQAAQELSRSVDKLDSANKQIERYIRDKRGKRLKDCADDIVRFEAKIQEHQLEIERIRKAIAQLDKEINEGGASLTNLRENRRIRKLQSDIQATQKEIDSCDLEGAAKAKRNFEERYQPEKDRETEMQQKSAHVAGELTSLRAQLNKLEGDLRDFRDINKKYTDQLVKVKISDMANNDLEKYAKALDNAIMRYHSLKMEEVNDTMRHIWNKTYQGTDIDGIRIRYDSEGGASKRSYNYRVVMTKDQVEMDMRGRCSAGQKMLASIIIRLALSDSFGQNCGILALDEPTNALDVENIDALAASLVDIINERKNHANFQLIIITHDESFLRKLGQSNVMEYYWRVSRDSKQKSVIERQRFG